MGGIDASLSEYCYIGTWRQKPSAGTTHGGSRPDLAATIMTEDAKTEENTAGSPCGAYIG